jgi:acetyltransferase-like isoleucine patch superfamily enzyme
MTKRPPAGAAESGQNFQPITLLVKDLPDEWFSHPSVRERFTDESVIELRDQSILRNKRFNARLHPVNIRSSESLHIRLQIGGMPAGSRLQVEVHLKGARNHVRLSDSISGSWTMYLYGAARAEIDSESHAGQLKIHVNHGCECFIGKDCLISDNVLLQCGDGHSLIDLSKRRQLNRRPSSIRIGNHCWLGRDSAVVTSSRKISIGSGSILGLGAVLTRSIPATSLAVGIPARVIRERISWHHKHQASSKQIDELCDMFPIHDELVLAPTQSQLKALPRRCLALRASLSNLLSATRSRFKV